MYGQIAVGYTRRAAAYLYGAEVGHNKGRRVYEGMGQRVLGSRAEQK